MTAASPTALQPVRLAHLSDVHLGPIQGFTPAFWNTKRAAGYLNWHRNRRHAYRRDVLERLTADLAAANVDQCLVSGDLCNIGLPAEMAAAAAWLATLGVPDRVAVVPGNHDIYTSIGEDRGVERWAPYMTGDPAYQYEADDAVRPSCGRLAFPYVRRIGDVAVIALNSAVETPPFRAHGELGSAQLSRLAVILDETGTQGLVRVVMLHHAPLPGQTRPSHALKDAAALRDVLVAHGAELVLHGHLHRALRASLVRGGGRPPVTVVGVPSAALGIRHPKEPLARYNILTITQDRLVVEGRGLLEPEGPVVTVERYEIAIEIPKVAR